MKKAIRLLVAFATMAMVVSVGGPASASHHNGTPDLPGAPHEPMPTPRVVNPATTLGVCVVVGDIVPGASGNQSYSHWVPPIVNNASHSHYQFKDTVINCDGTSVNVQSDGGNDGHIVSTCVNGRFPNDVPPSPGTCPDVPHGTTGAEGDHHGSTNDSGWSHSSDYNGDDASIPAACNTGGSIANKGDIDANDKGAGWVKYLRVGTVVYAWGCYDAPSLVGGGNTWEGHVFSTVLALFPPSVVNAGSGILAHPTCILADDIEEAAGQGRNDCGLTITGPAVRGTAFL